MDRQDDIDVPDMSQYVTATGANGDSPTGTQQVIAKMLISNSTAGSIIGKSGANIEQLQKSSGAHVQLSRTGELYPGTSDRVLLLSGSLHSVLTSIFLIFEKVARDASKAPVPTNAMPKSTRGDVEDSQVKLALSRKLCGSLIGHKGQTVQDFITDSGANIRVQSLSELTPSDPERTITVAGARDQVLRAVALVLNTLSLHEEYTAYMESTLQLANSQGVVMQPRSMNSKSALSGYRAAFTFFLPDEDVGAVLGKKGQNLIDIQQSARVMVKISDRSKMDPDTNEREVTVTGNYNNVKLAEAMIAEKLTLSKQQQQRRGDEDH